jgi:hypothetical protein
MKNEEKVFHFNSPQTLKKTSLELGLLTSSFLAE